VSATQVAAAASTLLFDLIGSAGRLGRGWAGAGTASAPGAGLPEGGHILYARARAILAFFKERRHSSYFNLPFEIT